MVMYVMYVYYVVQCSVHVCFIISEVGRKSPKTHFQMKRRISHVGQPFPWPLAYSRSEHPPPQSHPRPTCNLHSSLPLLVKNYTSFSACAESGKSHHKLLPCFPLHASSPIPQHRRALLNTLSKLLLFIQQPPPLSSPPSTTTTPPTQSSD